MNQKQNESQAPKTNPGKKKPNKSKAGNQSNNPNKPVAADKAIAPKKGVQSLKDLAELVRMVPRTNKKPTHSIRAPLPNLMKYKGDGIDHINISTDAKTELGKLLCSSSYLPFNHPVLGKFASIAAFNHYIVSAERDDRMRNATLKELRLLADAGTRVTVYGLWTLIFYATWIQVNSYPALVEALRTNELPFDLYKQKSFRGMPVTLFRPDPHGASVEIVEAIAEAIKSKKPPVFRSADLAKMIRLTEEFAVLGMTKAEEAAATEKTASLLKAGNDEKKEDLDAVRADIDRIHEQIVDPAAAGFTDITLVREVDGGVEYLMSGDGMTWSRNTLRGLVKDLYLNNNNQVLVNVDGKEFQLLEQYFCHTVGVNGKDTRFLHKDRDVVEKFDMSKADQLKVVEYFAMPDQMFAAIVHAGTSDIYIARQTSEITPTEELPSNVYTIDTPAVEIGAEIRVDSAAEVGVTSDNA